MSIPNTPLLVAPSDAANLVGKVIQSSELIRKLTKLNPRLFCPDIDDNNHIKSWHGVTSLWIGEPGGNGRPICGIRLGAIPEWTEIDKDGILVTKGWRAIFEKVIRFGATRRVEIEREFGISLEIGPSDMMLCRACVREGRRSITNGGVRSMCDIHDGAYGAADRAKSQGPEVEHRASWKKEKEIVC